MTRPPPAGRVADGEPPARVSVATASGPVELVAPPARFAGDSGKLGPVPALGEHGDAIRAEFSDAG